MNFCAMSRAYSVKPALSESMEFSIMLDTMSGWSIVYSGMVTGYIFLIYYIPSKH